MDIFHLLMLVLGAAACYAVLHWREARRKPDPLPAGEASKAEAEASRPDMPEIYRIAASLRPYVNEAPPVDELRRHPEFQRGVALLRSAAGADTDLLSYYESDSAALACMALEALKQLERSDAVPDIMAKLDDQYRTRLHFALSTLNDLQSEALIGPVLVAAAGGFERDASDFRALRAFIAQRRSAGEDLVFGSALQGISDDEADELERLLKDLGPEYVEALSDELHNRDAELIDLEYLRGFGRIWTADDLAGDSPITYKRLLDHVGAAESLLLKEPSRSVVLVGEPGVGKTVVFKVLAQRLLEQGWVIFEAGAAELMSGQKYIGELEGRVQTLLRKLSGGRKVLWYVPNFHELMVAGRHKYQLVSILDAILPHAEKGELRFVGETEATSFEKLLQAKPQVRTAVAVERIAPATDSEALEIVRNWAAHHSKAAGGAIISEKTIAEAFELVRQFLGNLASPGHILRFLSMTRKRLAAVKGKYVINHDELISTLGQLTGLPASILDDRQELKLETLRNFLNERVFGQPEAAECLIDRVAMIKAGLTDPTQPLGVFLFVGPTGTGKTEIAKTLAEYLFGSSERMIRLDMSEFAAPESIGRIVGDTDIGSDNLSLTDQIRNQPFAVLLLDEFEKASPHIWDLFLQVFDDGRLTDRRGNTADFRHCIIIMTSNLGAAIPQRESIGFLAEREQFTGKNVESAVEQVFRREFVNRIDRIVVFHPLERGVMRDLLHKELQAVLKRRGLRNRTWAVEWEDSAINFLLEKGYTEDLGARPLKRAIERYLLSPLALTIVSHQFPEGDQFLFVRSNGRRIEVEFIDPDNQSDKRQEELFPPFADNSGETDLPSLVLEPAGNSAEVALLSLRVAELDDRIAAAEWEQRKTAELDQASTPEFWESDERFGILGRVEFMDRIEEGMKTARTLMERLARGAEEQTFSAQLVQRLAQQVFLLDEACKALDQNKPRDSFLLIEAVRDGGAKAAGNNEFAMRIGKMYWNWAQKRKMKFDILEEYEPERSQAYRLLVAVSGFAAYSLLAPESGMHVMEAPGERKSTERSVARVRVVPQPNNPLDGKEALLATAQELLAEDEGRPAIVRRYRKLPSPLVRDAVRKWRTGRLDRVLEGDFDVMS